MPLPWKKSKSGRISRFVSDIQQSPKHGGSLVVETGFPTSLIDLFVKNRDRLKKSSSKRNNKAQNQTGSSHHPRRRVVSSPPSPPSSLHRPISLPQNLDAASVTEKPTASKIDENIVGGGGGVVEARNDGDGGRGEGGGGGCCVLMVVAVKVFVVAVLALSTKKLAVGITLSAFALLFLEFAVARVFTLFNLCPNAQTRIDSLIVKLIGKKQRKENSEEELSSSSSSTHDRNNKVCFEIVEDSRPWSEEIPPLEKKKDDLAEERQLQTIRDVTFNKIEKSKSSKLKSKIVKKIVPKKLRSYKKKKKMKMKKQEEEDEVEIILEEEEEEGGSVTEMSSLYSEERIESEISERDEIYSNPPLLEEEEEERLGSKGDLTKAIGLIVIVLAGLLNGKVLAIGLTLSWCLILKAFCCKSQTSL